MIYTFWCRSPKKTCLRANHSYLYKMCMKGGGGQPLEASWKQWAKHSVMSSSRPSNQQCCIHIVYTVSCFTPCERVSLDRLHADNLLTTQLMLVDGSRVLRRAVRGYNPARLILYLSRNKDIFTSGSSSLVWIQAMQSRERADKRERDHERDSCFCHCGYSVST